MELQLVHLSEDYFCGLIPGFMLAGMFAIWALIHSYFIDKDAAKALKIGNVLH